jgi:hypothetical protein
MDFASADALQRCTTAAKVAVVHERHVDSLQMQYSIGEAAGIRTEEDPSAISLSTQEVEETPTVVLERGESRVASPE